MANTQKVEHTGSCHCGAVQFVAAAPADMEALSCSCSMCSRTGFVHLIVEDEDFHITSGEEHLTEYRFNTGTARHLFCKICGVKAFYVPRSHPDGWSVNVNCLDKATVKSLSIEQFDGANWEENIDSIT